MRAVILFLLTFITAPSSAQHAEFKLLRYDENYEFLKDDSTLTWYKQLKYRPLSNFSNTYISTGGEIRYQYFWYQNPGWGEEQQDNDGFVLSRLLGHADLWLGRRLRLFAQIQSSLITGGTGEGSPVDENPLDLHQFFFDLHLINKGQEKLTLRLGRQEFSYGSQRLLSVREGPNNRQSFDAAKWIYTKLNFKADVFYSNYVVSRRQIFDDKFLNDGNQLWGAYLVFSQVPYFKNIDFYSLNLHKRKSVFDDGSGAERRYTIGTRIWKSTATWTYDFEAVYQFGKLARKSISAWTVSLNSSYLFENIVTEPRIGLKTELISGDEKHADNQINTFNPLYPKGAYFGLAALIGPYNLNDLHPYIELRLTDKLTLQTDCDFFWRMSRNDGLYAVNGSILYSANQINARYIGNQLGTELYYQPNSHLTLRTEFTWFNSGNFLKQAGSGKDIYMIGATMQFKF